MRIALVTPILPVPHDLTRGRYIHETARALSRLATVRVFLGQPRYPAIPGLAPRSFLAGSVGADYALEGIDLEAFTYPALPGLSRIGNGVVASRYLLPRLRGFVPELVLGYWIYPDGEAARLAARSLGIPCIVGARGSDIHVRAGLAARMTRRTLQRADAMLTVSQAMRDRAISEFGVAPDKVHTVVNGIDTTVFHPRDRAEMRKHLGLPADARIVLYVGRFVLAKGMDELFEAFGRLAEADPTLHLTLVGDGVMQDALSARAREATWRDRVHMPGAMEPAEVAQWIGAADLLTLPSWSEGYPNVLVEAIASGRPVVATAVGGAGEIVGPDSGVLVPPRCPDALAAALDCALRRTWDPTTMAAAARRSWSDVARDTLDVCQQVLADARRPELESGARHSPSEETA